MSYFNNAATTWPKPECVASAMKDFLINGGANSSRGTSSKRDLNTMNLILDCRMKLCDFFGGYDALNVTFTANITESLNIVLRGFLKPGMKVLTSSMEHNAVMRPLRALESNGVKIEILRADSEGMLNPDDLEKLLKREKFDLMVFAHASNVCGTIQPLKEIAKICRENNLPLVLDTAQTAGLIEVNASELGLAALCFTGHKSLMGPQGTGGIIWNPDFAKKVTSIITGGTGSYSHLEFQPEDLPDKFESGTPNLPGIAGLNAAIDWIQETGVKKIFEKENELGKYFLERLKNFENLILTGKREMKDRLSVFSFNVKNFDNGILADELSLKGFETRPGLHCAPAAHKTLGTFPQGALRVSPGYFNNFEQIDNFIEAFRLINS